MKRGAFAILAPVFVLVACSSNNAIEDAAASSVERDAGSYPDPSAPDLATSWDRTGAPADLAVTSAPDLSMVPAAPDLASSCVAKTPTTYLSEIFCTNGKQNLCLSDHPPNGF